MGLAEGNKQSCTAQTPGRERLGLEEIKIPSPVAGLLQWWLLQVRPLVAAKLSSVYLTGGVPLGDFRPKWSDINLCVVLEQALSPDEAQHISAVQADLSRLFLERRTSEWQSWRSIHGVFVPKEIVTTPSAQAACYVVAEKGGHWSTGDPLLPFDRYLLTKSALLWMGEEQLFAPPSKESLILQAEKEFAELSAEKLERRGALWIASEMQALARSLAFWRKRRLIGKTEALKREIAAGGPLAEQFRFALQLREQGILGIGVHLNLLREQLAAMIEPAGETLRALLKQAREKAGQHQ